MITFPKSLLAALQELTELAKCHQFCVGEPIWANFRRRQVLNVGNYLVL